MRFRGHHLLRPTRSSATSHRQPHLHTGLYSIGQRRLSGGRPSPVPCDITTSPLIDLTRLSPETRARSSLQNDFQLFPNFLNSEEQHVLLSCALKKLDEVIGLSREARKRRREWQHHQAQMSQSPTNGTTLPVDSLFPPEDTCTFKEVSCFVQLHLIVNTVIWTHFPTGPL